ncbi:hypothetical protein GCM10009038_07950 [Salinicola rhizosphaerae]|uniref:Uncharacterized protein n=1 Tax=Salinicola rhizosphaerae TaxID=1443141 RepID=A0ABQ3DR14_9GAMM|nr:hypothetical protein GCM10009038_07950 [Salinicola rhizosphaerae]
MPLHHALELIIVKIEPAALQAVVTQHRHLSTPRRDMTAATSQIALTDEATIGLGMQRELPRMHIEIPPDERDLDRCRLGSRDLHFEA